MTSARSYLSTTLAFAALALLVYLNWLQTMTAAPLSLEEGRVLTARSELHAKILQAGGPEPGDVRAYLQARHITQGVAGGSALNCQSVSERNRLKCLGLNSATAIYNASSASDAHGGQLLKLGRGRDQHVTVTMRRANTVANMIIDTGSMATILPHTFHGAVVRNLRETKISNLGRLATLMLVRTDRLRLGKQSLDGWVAATSSTGFADEGVLGLDVLYAAGGFEVDQRSAQVRLLGGQCEGKNTLPVRLVDGALIAAVHIDGVEHQALVDSGSVRSFVFDPVASGGLLRVSSDFGDARLVGGFKQSTITVGDHQHIAELVHTADRSSFYPGTTALLGLDVLLSGRVFGVCFEPSRIWID